MFKRLARAGLNYLLKRRGQRIMYAYDLYEWQLNPVTKPVFNPIVLPAGTRDYLKPDNPRLLDLQRRYGAFNPEVTKPLEWVKGYVRDEDIAHFRGDNAYVWQLRGGSNIMGYALAVYYTKSIDTFGLLDKLQEDDSFGVFLFEIAGKLVSRDLIDSILEIYFLDRHLGIESRQDFTVLDIGAGYGRLAHRSVQALPGLKNYFCTDAVPFSTFISEYYLRYRQVDHKATVIPLDEIDNHLTSWKVDLALNINSFPECQLAAINWWVALLEKHAVKNLFVGANSLQTNQSQDFSSILHKHNYKLIAHDPKYGDPVVQQYGANSSSYYLFELT
jgi:hypothetical protein